MLECTWCHTLIAIGVWIHFATVCPPAGSVEWSVNDGAKDQTAACVCVAVCRGASFSSYSFLADGLPLGQPLPFLQGLLLHLRRAELGLVLLEVNLELLSVSHRRLFKWLTTEGDKRSQGDKFKTYWQQTRINDLCNVASFMSENALLAKKKINKQMNWDGIPAFPPGSWFSIVGRSSWWCLRTLYLEEEVAIWHRPWHERWRLDRQRVFDVPGYWVDMTGCCFRTYLM